MRLKKLYGIIENHGSGMFWWAVWPKFMVEPHGANLQKIWLRECFEKSKPLSKTYV